MSIDVAACDGTKALCYMGILSSPWADKFTIGIDPRCNWRRWSNQLSDQLIISTLTSLS